MAEVDAAKLEELLADLTPSGDASSAMLADLAKQSGILLADLTDPDELPSLPDPADLYVKRGELFQLACPRAGWCCDGPRCGHGARCVQQQCRLGSLSAARGCLLALFLPS